MAITRTQIAKQLLEKGGRVGLKNGPAGGASAGGNYGGTRNPEQTYVFGGPPWAWLISLSCCPRFVQLGWHRGCKPCQSGQAS